MPELRTRMGSPRVIHAGEGSTVSRPADQPGGAGSSPATRSRLLVAPCNFRAAEHAVTNWHYSRAMPAGKTVKFGVWENDRFIGAVLFGRGSNNHLGGPYGLGPTEVCELVRIALRQHEAPVTRIVSETIRGLRRSSPGLRLIVSFADPGHGHHGGIYQAGNWLYLGLTMLAPANYMIRGRKVHARTISSLRSGRVADFASEPRLAWIRKHVDPHATEIHDPPKHRYAYPLDRQMRRRLAPLAQPYPPALESP